MSQIKKICVIGSGVMGAGIAAQIANSKTAVILLDIIPGAASIAREKMLLGKIPQIAHPSLMKYVTAGNLDEDLSLIGACDWVIEVIVEKLEMKTALYSKIIPYMKKGAILSSNTSTLPMGELRLAVLLSSVDIHFLLTHFFNPPRQMKLLEIIYDQTTDRKVVQEMKRFITTKLGKTIIKSNDTPGFIANRIGCFLMEICLKEAYEKKLSIPYIDNYLTKELGLPSTGVFGLFDLIGLDIMQMISNVLLRALPKEDEFCVAYQRYDWYDKMIAQNYKGRKGLGGFYRMRDVDGKKIKEVLDFNNMEYVAIKSSSASAKVNDDITSIIQQFFSYVNGLLGVVSHNKEDIDTVMKLGYSWKRGPFEMMGDAHQVRTSLVAQYPQILHNPSATLYQALPGTLVFTIHTKMNTLDENIFNLLIGSIDYAEKHKAEKLIIYNEGRNFSAGANLKLFLEMGEKGNMELAEKFLKLGQKAMMRIKYSKVPVVACAKGVALGGGCELLLHAHKVFAHLDLVAGLVEVGVGLIPGWGGCKEMILRAVGDNTKIIKNLRNIVMQNKSSSAYWFFDDYMVENGEVVMNEEELLDMAIAWPVDEKVRGGVAGGGKIDSHADAPIDLISSCVDLKLDNHTLFILKELQDAINSDSLSEERIFEIERMLFKKLLVAPEVLDKIKKLL